MKKNLSKKSYLMFFIISSSILLLVVAFLHHKKKNAYLIVYEKHIKHFHKALQLYADNHDNLYPPPSKWCDLLIEHVGVPNEYFVSPWAGDPLYHDTTDPNDNPYSPIGLKLVNEYDDSQGQHHYSYVVLWCHFALNPNTKPDSPGDTVLLFSTKGGWNQSGGLEILSTKNYLQIDRDGCYVLFNDGRVEFVKTKDIGKLKWNDADNEKVGNNP